MATTEVEIYNLALSAIGTRARISSPSEETREAQICNLWYPVVRDTALRAAPWACSRVTARLAVSGQRLGTEWVEGDPEPPWFYRYALPVDFLYPRWLDDYSNFVLGSYDNKTMLLTNSEDAILTYTKKQNNPASWDVDLYRAISLGLAAAIAMPLHGKADRANVMIQDANTLLLQARVNAANENMQELDAMPDWLMARGATVNSNYNKFIYQYGPLFSIGALA